MKSSSEHSTKPKVEKLPPISFKSLIADDVRIEVDGKVSVLGLFPDDIITIDVPPEIADPSATNHLLIEGMTILTTVFNLPGPTLFQIILRNPSGKIAAKGSTLIASGLVNNAISKFRPLPVSKLGLWKLEFIADSLNYEYEFHIKRRTRPNVLPPAVKAVRKPRKKPASS